MSVLSWLKKRTASAPVRQAELDPVMAAEQASLDSVATLAVDTAPLREGRSLNLPALLLQNEANGWTEAAPWLERLDLPEMTGGVNPGDQRALYALAAALEPDFVLEIGTHIGCSTVSLALALRRRRLSLSGGQPTLVSVDLQSVNDPATKPWEQFGAKFSPAELIDRIGMIGAVRFLQADSLTFLAETRQLYDFIFLDGLHSAERVYQEIPQALRKLAPNGVIVLHDFFPNCKPLWSNGVVIPGPYLAVERLRAEGAPLQAIPLGDLPWPTKLGSNRTSLAVLVREDR